MTFFNKNQDVIDIKLTQFGKNLLARGFFRPAYYRFFDDDILYNSECAGFKEEQNKANERILSSARPRTQHNSTSVLGLFDEQENMINSGEIRTFMEIKRSQDPFISEKLLKYPLQDTIVNNSMAPNFNISLMDVTASAYSSTINVNGLTLPVPQMNLTSSYSLIRDEKHKINEHNIPIEVRSSQNFIDIMSEKVKFLDETFIHIDKNDVVIHLEEANTYDFNENFEVEVYEIDDTTGEERIIRLTKEDVEKYFSISFDEAVATENIFDSRNSRFRNNRGGN